MTDEKPRHAPPLDPTKDWVKQPEGHYAARDKLLPLPRPACVYADERHPAYTAVQMQEYARATLAATSGKALASCDREPDAKLYAAAPMLVEALLKLANATDAVGVAHFDTDDMSDEVTEMQAATLEARRALAAAGVK